MPSGDGVNEGPKKAMVLAAGLGLRLRPITDNLPKPLVTVDDRTLLDRALDRLVEANVETAVVNTHYLGQRIEQHLKNRKDLEIVFSREDELLETGGGVKQALDLLGADAFYVVNSDSMWLDGYESTLLRMADAWDEEAMDALLLLHFTADAYGYDGFGDFLVDDMGRLTRRPEREVSPYLFTGVQILHPRLFEGSPAGKFSLNVLYDRALEAERIRGVVHDGEWFHIGTPDGLAEAETFMKQSVHEAKRPGRRRS